MIGRLSEQTLLMIQEAGFVPCYVADIENGDTIMIDHDLNRDYTKPSLDDQIPTEMLVTELDSLDRRVTNPGEIRHWVGMVTRNGLRVHCCYNRVFECWKLTELGREAREQAEDGKR